MKKDKMIKKLKTPKIFEETDEFIEVEILEGKSEEYNLEGFHYFSSGQDFNGNFYEYWSPPGRWPLP